MTGRAAFVLITLVLAAASARAEPPAGDHEPHDWKRPDRPWRPAWRQGGGNVRWNDAPKLLPEVTANPKEPEYRQFWRGTRDYGPARERNGIFIGGHEERLEFKPRDPEPYRFEPAAIPRDVVADAEPAAAAPAPFDWSTRLPEPLAPPAVAAAPVPKPAARADEPGVQTDFSARGVPESLGALDPAPYHEIAQYRPPAERLIPVRTVPAHLPLPSLPGSAESLEPLGAPAGPAGYEREVDALLEGSAERAAAAPKELSRLPSGPKELLPRLGAAPQHEAPAAEAKPVIMEDVDAPALAHNALPDLIAMLQGSASAKMKARVADELGSRGKAAAEAEPALIAAVADKDARLKASAALALGNVGSDKAKLKKVLSPLLKHASADVRTSAQTALDRLEN